MLEIETAPLEVAKKMARLVGFHTKIRLKSVKHRHMHKMSNC